MSVWLSVTLALGALLAGLLLMAYQPEPKAAIESADEDLPPDLLSAIRELRQDLDTGKLTAEEFEEAKAALLQELPGLLALSKTAMAGSGGNRLSGSLAAGLVAVLLLGGTALAWQREQARAGAVETAKAEFKRTEPERTGVPPDVMAMVERLQDRLKKNPNDLKGQLMLGRSMLSLGKLKEAKDAYMTASKLDPGSAEALSGLGLVLMSANEVEAAGQAFDAALQRDPDFQEALYYRALIFYQGENAPAKALPLVRRLITIIEKDQGQNPQGGDAEKAIQQLKQLESDLINAAKTTTKGTSESP